ncbi:MAG: hypothetical protein DRP42_00555 [Tenericutes bacterium]|nr:MAG: hypothetical protein DRP42_00555 [Mycoplasmatota bacterium]
MSSRPLLKHLFTGPQISMLRGLKRTGAQSYGIVQVGKDLAYCLAPCDIPNEGQVDSALLLSVGRAITRASGWKFWAT